MRKHLLRFLFHCSCLAVVLVLSPSTARAISALEYQQNVKRSITALDTLTQNDEDETESAFDSRFHVTVSMFLKIMPESQMVDCGEELCTVDNRWVHEGLKEVENNYDSN